MRLACLKDFTMALIAYTAYATASHFIVDLYIYMTFI